MMWGRSYMLADTVRKGNTMQYIELGSASGTVLVRFGHDGKPTHLEGSWEHVKSETPKKLLDEMAMEGSSANSFGFGYNKQVVGDPPRGVIVDILLPYWLVFLLAIPSAVRW